MVAEAAYRASQRLGRFSFMQHILLQFPETRDRIYSRNSNTLRKD
jgi:hypothetical protein